MLHHIFSKRLQFKCVYTSTRKEEPIHKEDISAFLWLFSGGGEGGSWPSLWLWSPCVSLWKDTLWKQEWTLFLPLQSNELKNPPQYTDDHNMNALRYLLVFQVESIMEAKLWNKIFLWTQQKVCTRICANTLSRLANTFPYRLLLQNHNSPSPPAYIQQMSNRRKTHFLLKYTHQNRPTLKSDSIVVRLLFEPKIVLYWLVYRFVN